MSTAHVLLQAPRRMARGEVARAAAASGPPAAGLVTLAGELVACTANWDEATGLAPEVPLVDALRPADAVDLLRALGRTDRRLSLALRAGRRDAAVEALLHLEGAWVDGVWHLTARRAFQHRHRHVNGAPVNGAAANGVLRLPEAASDAAWVTAIDDGRLVHANPAWHRLTGAAQDGVRGWAGWVHPRDRDRVESELDVWIADGADGPLRCAFAVAGADGERQLVAVASAVHGTDGCVEYVSGVAMDVTEIAGIGVAVAVDPLTGLVDRRGLERALDDALTRCRHGDTAALLLIDLDGFKAVNDAHGHGIGDELLAAVGARLQAAVRDGDVAARLGGDEFAIVMRRSTPTEARAAAERLLSAVRRARPVSIEISAAVEGSAGLAAFVPGDPVSVDEALRRADLALYDAKAAGRGTVIAYPTGDGHAARQLHVRRSSVQRLAQALREDALELRARPVVDLHDGSLGGWDLAVPGDGGTTVEAEARRAGLTAHLDVWKLRRLVELAATGVAAPLGIVVDAAVLDDPALAPRLEADLRRSGAAPTRIVLGVVGTGGAPTAQAVATAQALRRLGVDLLLDDFGAGPGSLALLRGLPVSVIRTSAAVACAGSANAFDDGVVRFAADLAREFGLGIVADGVGSAADLERLRALGVRAGLGPYLGEPLSLDIAFARTPPDNQEDADECV